MAFPIVTPAEQIGQLYVGYFGRAADPAGLEYWIDRFNAGMSLLAIANSFAVQPEATSLYAYLAAPSVGDPVAFINNIYQDLFNRQADAAGLVYWISQLTVQGTLPGRMVLDIISGAQGADITTIQNKTHVAVGYAQKFIDSNVAWSEIDGMAGARAVVMPVTDDPATVVAAIHRGEVVMALGDYHLAFETGLMTNVINPASGLVPIVGEWGPAGVGETMWLVNDPAITNGAIKINLSGVGGSTSVFGNGSVGSLMITGSVGATNTLFGSFAGDTIVAKGTGVGFGSNFIWGGLGGDTETGVAGGSNDNVGTVFLINDKGESPGSAYQVPNKSGVHITNFHSTTDTLLVNPTQLALGDVPAFVGIAADFGQALALLGGGGHGVTQAVYQSDIHALWIDANDDGLLNTLDIEVLVDFSSPGFGPGSINFGNLLGLFDGSQAAAFINAALPQGGNTIFSGALLPGEILWGSPGDNDKLTLDNGVVANGIVFEFEKLEILAGKSGELSVAQWNSFWPHITGLGATTAIFSDGAGVPETAMTAVATIANYDFSRLGNGITMSAGGSSGGPTHGPGTITGTPHMDTFNVSGSGLKAGFLIDGGGSADVLHLDATADISGSSVINIEILELASGASVAMSAQTWDQFVGSNGLATPGHSVTGAGSETVTLVTTTAATAAYVGDHPIEGYVLANAGNDFLRIHQGSTAYHAQVTLTAGGSDFFTLDNAITAFGDNNVAADLFGFAAGSIVNTSDVLQIQHGGAGISNHGFEAVAAPGTDIGAGISTVVINSNVATIIGAWNQAGARTALDTAIDRIAIGEYAMVVYSGMDAAVMAVKINTADSLIDATVDLVGVLHDVGANALVGFNFA